MMIDEEDQHLYQHTTQIYMNNYHRTLVPIGTLFQVIVPPIITEQAYKIKSRARINALRILKIHDPQQSEEFYNKYFQLVENYFGPGRTYEDVNHLRNALIKVDPQMSF